MAKLRQSNLIWVFVRVLYTRHRTRSGLWIDTAPNYRVDNEKHRKWHFFEIAYWYNGSVQPLFLLLATFYASNSSIAHACSPPLPLPPAHTTFLWVSHSCLRVKQYELLLDQFWMRCVQLHLMKSFRISHIRQATTLSPPLNHFICISLNSRSSYCWLM